MPRNTAAAEVETTVDEQAQAEEMAPELRDRCDKVRKALVKAGPQDTRARYQLGELVKDAKTDEEKYGKKAVAQIAVSLGYDEKTLYRYALVAKAWSLDELNELLKQSSLKTGMPIGFSHLLEIAGIDDKRKRRKYVNQVLKEGLSVRELKVRITAERVAAGEEPEIDTAKTLSGMRSASKNWLGRVRDWEERLLPALDGAPPTPEVRAKFEEMLEQQRELVKRLQNVNERLDSWLGAPPASAEQPTLKDAQEDELEEDDEAEASGDAEAHDHAQAEEEDEAEEEAAAPEQARTA
ncbi:DUF1016 N-terminal domain-containing protein [Polyangium mundeleinium]|uniref:DUF1016 family protein n=1 Tax=Polyangium mundeleinium TaxID=2995306 RepID=A0ABT5EN02_9BACT|nr:hypothetical protein [Polyangium mundeleinium]MDC0743210.1 hypothetical protein [Polyangium mundeleinium]